MGTRNRLSREGGKRLMMQGGKLYHRLMFLRRHPQTKHLGIFLGHDTTPFSKSS